MRIAVCRLWGLMRIAVVGLGRLPYRRSWPHWCPMHLRGLGTHVGVRMNWPVDRRVRRLPMIHIHILGAVVAEALCMLHLRIHTWRIRLLASGNFRLPRPHLHTA